MESFVSQLVDIPSFDGTLLQGKLALPSDRATVEKLVIFVNGSGANTYDNKRPGFNYFDLFREQFAQRGVAFFSYSTRGCTIGDQPPMYVDIDRERYQTYLPLNSVEDVYCMITALKEMEPLRDCKVYLLGASEGTVIAPLVAEKHPALVDGLLLVGYVNQNMREVLEWQNNGSPSMAWYKDRFGADAQGRITKEAYEADPCGVVASVLKGATFASIDGDHDGYISKEDFALVFPEIVGYTLQDVLSAIHRRDDEWLRRNYGGRGLIPLTSGWFLQHFSLRATAEVLPLLDLPIHIFHGRADQNVDVAQVYQIDEVFREREKRNLTVHVFEHHNHDLNYEDYITKKEVSPGLRAIFDCVVNL